MKTIETLGCLSGRRMFPLLVLTLAGCVGSTHVLKEPFDLGARQHASVEVGAIVFKGLEAPAGFESRFRKHLDGELAARNLAAADRPATHTLEVEVTGLRIRGISRIWGFLAGKDRILSTVRLLKKGTSAAAGQATAENDSISPAFDMAQVHARTIARLVAGEKVGASEVVSPLKFLKSSGEASRRRSKPQNP